MAINRAGRVHFLGREWGERGLVGIGVMGLAVCSATLGLGVENGRLSGTIYYSTAAPPREYVGPEPALTALDQSPPARLSGGGLAVAEAAPVKPAENKPAPPAPPAEAPRVASTAGTRAAATPPPAPPHPTVLAKKAIADCQERFKLIQDYTCTFVKRERIDGRLSGQNVMNMKARATPVSIYFKFQKPNRGREAIYVAGRHGNRILAHDVGVGKLVAGTMKLDPRGSMAMEDNRHPITDAGIAALIETVARHWTTELTPEESKVTFHTNIQVGGRPCTMIESVHPRPHPSFMFHIVKLYIDHEHGLPIRFEAYDWPKHPNAAPELVEEYTYLNLRTNLGLRDADFDPANAQYSYGHF